MSDDNKQLQAYCQYHNGGSPCESVMSLQAEIYRLRATNKQQELRLDELTDKGGDIYEPLASDAARQVVLIEDQAKVIARLRRDNHKLCGLLQTACEAAEVNGRWSVLHPAWFVEAEKLARMLP